MDLIVRQAVEAGVRSIVPVSSARSIPEPSEPKLARWRRIAREALQQSGSAHLPDIGEPVTLRKAAGIDRRGGLGLVFHQERVAAGSLHGALFQDAGAAERGAFILIGPEGGLAEDEVDILLEAGFRPVHLGGTVLRVETAAVYAIAAVMTILRERDTWTASNRT